VGAGLIVARVYGHSRFREWILGGVTKRLVNRQAAVLRSRADSGVIANRLAISAQAR
jgi:hypothetical protein